MAISSFIFSRSNFSRIEPVAAKLNPFKISAYAVHYVCNNFTCACGYNNFNAAMDGKQVCTTCVVREKVYLTELVLSP